MPFADKSFDLVFSWGVIHHTISPIQALNEFVRVLRPGGVLILAVYLKTPLTAVHEAVRHACLRLPDSLRPAIIQGITQVVVAGEMFGFTNNSRPDNPRIASQVEDWYFVPVKHFTTPKAMDKHFTKRGLSFELLNDQTGRYRSSSNFLVRGTLS